MVKLAAGGGEQTRLPFSGFNSPGGVAVDGTGAVYVSDYGNNRVLELAARASQQTVVAFSGLNQPDGVAVDDAGAVYVTEVGATGCSSWPQEPASRRCCRSPGSKGPRM